jgi:hypothetical protein
MAYVNLILDIGQQQEASATRISVQKPAQPK